MFKNEYLKQLKEVQAKIRACQASIAKLNPPIPELSCVRYDVGNWILTLIQWGNISTTMDALNEQLLNFDKESIDYLRQLGEYFVNVSDYEREKREFEKELRRLREEEAHLKEKLGID
jgi:hypothetical protein